MATSLLTIKKLAADIKKQYDEDPRTKSYNAIIYSDKGVGKTSILKTARKPVLVHSFDPDGTIVLEDEIAKGEVIADTEFEIDDPWHPVACDLWESKFNKLRSTGFFNHLGTFCIDSTTTWMSTIMYKVIAIAAKKKSKRTVGGHPHLEDWAPQMAFAENYMRIFTTLPCDCILLGHSDRRFDEEGNPLEDETILLTGKLRKRIPALFSEVYRLEITDKRKGTRQLLTQPKYGVQAGTRLGRDGRFKQYEEPDIKALLRKAGMSVEDKPLFHELEEQEKEN